MYLPWRRRLICKKILDHDKADNDEEKKYNKKEKVIKAKDQAALRAT
jgi:hypothetical protein